ncbi:MAG: lipocalin family protein [Bacteroidia bacterium]|nr:lipocalin family protein [Bacteroidia bacterium]MCF8427427.1 lipocalin family protein [Bacteroidia bacterium]MCF8447090.1 lipocalin family protein [Bacteroidia bacterium]
MKALKVFALGLAVISLTFSACKKDETTTTDNTPSGSSYLTGKDWRMIGATMVSPGGSIDIYATMEACEKDDLLEFKTDNTIVEKAGATKCDPADPDTAPGGNWALINSDKQLRIIDGDTTDLTVLELNATTMRVNMVEDDMGIIYTTTFTFTKN